MMVRARLIKVIKIPQQDACVYFRADFSEKWWSGRDPVLVVRTQRIVLTGDIPQLHSEQLYGLHSSPNVIRVTKSQRMGWAGHVARVWDRRRAYKGLVRRPDAKRRVGKPTH
jgi:hypothetical protein